MTGCFDLGSDSPNKESQRDHLVSRLSNPEGALKELERPPLKNWSGNNLDLKPLIRRSSKTEVLHD